MQYSCCLINSEATLVLDTSVIINLHASGEAARILEIIPNPIVITENVIKELRGEYNESSEQRALLEKLQQKGILKILSLQDQGFNIYARLVSEPNSLDDGEAATIALALERRFLPVIDERKGLRRLLEEKPEIIAPSTIDLFTHPSVLDKFGNAHVANIFYNALIEARMRIPFEARKMVIDLIGVDRALQCNSLPNFKQWRHEILENNF